MLQHGNAALSIAQGIEIKRFYHREKVSSIKLMAIYQVSRPAIKKWVARESPFDLSSTADHMPTVITDAYRQAVLKYRQENPHHGPVRIACELKGQYIFANRGRLLKILQQKQLTVAKKGSKVEHHLPVGRHRVQMDIQPLPCIEGDKGFGYKIIYDSFSNPV